MIHYLMCVSLHTNWEKESNSLSFIVQTQEVILQSYITIDEIVYIFFSAYEY